MIPRSTTITDGGRRIRRGLIIVGVFLVVGNLVTSTLGRFLGGERVTGPEGSSYVTTAYGTAALAELFEDEGVGVSRLRAPYTPARLDPGQALIVVEAGLAELAEPESRAIEDFVDKGGRLLVAGVEPGGLLTALTPTEDSPMWQPDGPLSATSSLAGVGGVPLDGMGSFTAWDQTDAFLVGDDGEAVGVEWAHGSGRVMWLADSSPLLNSGLAGGDSAGLAFALIGDRDVMFDEYRHGFGGESFWQLLPGGWAGALALLGVAGLTWMIGYGRRLGPPEDTERTLQPERALYVESVAAILGRTNQIGDAIAPVRARFRRVLTTRTGLSADASDDELRKAALSLGLSAEEIDSALDDMGDPVAAGRALAQLNTRR